MKNHLFILFVFYYFLLNTTSAATESVSLLLNYRQYSHLKLSDQKEYISKVRDEIFNLEQKLKPTSINTVSQQSYLQLLINEAIAADSWEKKCLIGGIIRRTVNGKCPVWGRSCFGDTQKFKCGIIYGSGCVDIKPIEELSKRCSETKESKKPMLKDTYLRFAEVFESGVNQLCPKAPPSGTEPCRTFEAKVIALKNDFVNKTSPEPAPVQVINEQSFGIKNNVCEENKNQGQLGTCHAFCLTCVYDHAMYKKTNQNFRVSENWIAFISVVKKMCDNPGDEQKLTNEIIARGWHPSSNLNILNKIGACSKTTFHDYKSESWASGFPLPPPPSTSSGSKGINNRPRLNINEEAIWINNFGISQQTAWDLFCPTSGKTLEDELGDYESRLQNLMRENKINGKFKECALESLKNKTTLEGDNPSPMDCGNDSKKTDESNVDYLKKSLLASQGPIPVAITTTVDGHGAHCITATGFDDKTQKFKFINSWGNNTQFNELTYDQVNNQLLYSVSANCPIVNQNMRSPAKADQNSAPVSDKTESIK